MKVFGTNNMLYVGDKPDSDNELELFITCNTGHESSCDTWINEEDAVKLINHLNKAFGFVAPLID